MEIISKRAMIKKLLLAAGLIGWITWAFACGQKTGVPIQEAGREPKDSEGIRIGYTSGTMDNPYQQEFSAYLQQLCDEKGISLAIMDGENDVAKQMLHIQEWIDEEFDAVICSPIEPNTLQPVIDKCMGEGIPFINVDSVCERYTTYLGIEQEEYGYIGGKIAADWINQNYPENERIACAVLTKPQSLAVIERANGIIQGIEENCKFADIIVTKPYSDIETAKEAVKEIMQEYPDVKCIVGVSDMSILGAYQACEEMGLLEKDLCLVGMDATEPVLKLVQQQTIVKGTVSQSTKLFAYKAIEAVEQAMAGEPLDKVFLEIEAVTYENVDNFIKD